MSADPRGPLQGGRNEEEGGALPVGRVRMVTMLRVVVRRLARVCAGGSGALPPHSVSGDDAQLRAVFQEHVPCGDQSRGHATVTA